MCWTAILMLATPVALYAQEGPVTTVEGTTSVVQPSTAPSVVGEAVKAFTEVGPPEDMSVQGLIAWAVFFLITFGLGYAGKRWSNWATFTDALDVVADRVYLEKIEGDKDGKLSGAELRQAGYDMLIGMGGVAAKEALRYGPEYVMAKLHDRANKKKQAAASAQANAAVAERAKATTPTAPPTGE